MATEKVTHEFDAKHKTYSILRTRIGVLGDAAVGKTALCRLLSGSDYPRQYVMTTAVELSTVSLPVGESGKAVRVEALLLDCPGSSLFNMREDNSKVWESCNMFLIVFDISNRESFTSAAVWLRRALSGLPPGKRPMGVIVGNKSESRDVGVDRAEVSVEDAKTFASSVSFDYFETSAELGKDHRAPFEHLANMWYAAYTAEMATAASILQRKPMLPDVLRTVVRTDVVLSALPGLDIPPLVAEACTK